MKKDEIQSRTDRFRFMFLIVAGVVILATVFYHNVVGRMKGGPLVDTTSVSLLLDTEAKTGQDNQKGSVSGPVSEIDRIVTVQNGEGLIAVARRTGVKLTLNEAIKMAEDASRPVIWYRPVLGKEATIFAPSLNKGEPVAVYKDGHIRIMAHEEMNKARF